MVFENIPFYAVEIQSIDFFDRYFYFLFKNSRVKSLGFVLINQLEQIKMIFASFLDYLFPLYFYDSFDMLDGLFLTI